ncbi:MAG: peptidylprolyl isomerase [Planctomycetia bacterium]|nr:peptidylprolyl isomerase [Planctomycetia bacterium]
MRLLKIVSNLLVFSTFGVFSACFVSDISATWWNKDDSKAGRNSETVIADSTSGSRAGSAVSDKSAKKKSGFWARNEKSGDSGNANTNPDRFLSYSEQQEKEREAEKAEKGVFIRFPWAKKDEAEEVADPFGNVKEEGPAYQDLEELGITPSQNMVQSPSQMTLPGQNSYPAQGTQVVQGGHPVQNSQVVQSPYSVPADSVAQPAYTPTTLNPAPENVAVGTAVELPTVEETPVMEASVESSGTSVNLQDGQNVLNGQETESEIHVTPASPAETVQSDMILKQLPSLTADTTNLAGEGIQFYEHGQVLAQVGSQVILSGDIVSQADRIMEENREKIPEQYWDMQREILIRMLLNQVVERKLIYCDVIRNVPSEGIQQNLKLIDDLFEDTELPDRMKKAGVQLREDYEKILAEEGTCILKQKYLYREMVLCQQWMMKTIPQNPTVSYREISDYYHENPKEFETQPRARWEELVIRKSRFYSREEAYQEIVRIGSMVAVQKKPFAEVAREFSHGVTASSGGVNDWIKPGQLASDVLENAIFTQPVGVLSSQIVEDDNCFYIVRVLEREELIRKPIGDVQKLIHDKIKNDKINKVREEYFTKLKKEIPVFTVFDGVPSPEERLRAEQEAREGNRRPTGFGI